MKSKNVPERVWFQNVRDLFKHPSRFWPTRTQTPGGQVNAMVRFVLYAAIATYAYNRDSKTLYFALAIVTIISLSYDGTPGGRMSNIAPLRCKRPTAQNPFMNHLVSEYGQEDLPPCDYDDVKDDVRTHFNKGLPRNIEDLYEKQNSQREFLTMPNGGLPPDSREFAEFLYGGMKSCKEYPSHCDGTR